MTLTIYIRLANIFEEVIVTAESFDLAVAQARLVFKAQYGLTDSQVGFATFFA